MNATIPFILGRGSGLGFSFALLFCFSAALRGTTSCDLTLDKVTIGDTPPYKVVFLSDKNNSSLKIFV